jgi:hypothetical protein
MLLDADRRLAHRSAGLWLEAQRERDALTVAQHLEAGGEEARAALWYRYAAEHALDAGDPRAVIDRAARGLECGAVDHERGRALCSWPAWPTTGWARLTPPSVARSAPSTPPARAPRCGCGPPPSWRWSPAGSATTTSWSGWPAISSARAPARPAAIGSPRWRWWPSELLLVGHGERAHRLLARLEELRDAWSTDSVAGAWRLRAQSIAALVGGDSVAALTLMRSSTELMEQVGARRDQASGLTNVGLPRDHGRPGRGRRGHVAPRAGLGGRPGRGADHHGGDPRTSRWRSTTPGQPHDSLRTARTAEVLARQQDSLRLAGAALVYQARAHLALGQAALARTAAARALEALAAMPPTLCYAQAAAAEAALADGDLAGALAAAAAAERLLDGLGAIEEGDAYVRLVLARVRSAAGDRAEAARLAAAALGRLERAAAGLSDPAARATFAAMPEHVALAALVT